MEPREHKYVVPAEFAEDATRVVTLLREAAASQGKEAEVYLMGATSSETREFAGPAELSAAVLLIGGPTVSWLTKHWVDAYLWPLVQQRVDGPSRKFIDWLSDRLPGNSKPEKSH
jgi:hypothetical protein